jgi:DNA-binding transcriptional MerR regulator
LTFESGRRLTVDGVRISELAERSGVPATTLRFYEQAGLLPAERSPAGYRRYDEGDAVQRLAFISSGKSLGLPLAEIRDLLAVSDQCSTVRERLKPLVAARIAAADQQAAELAAFAAQLARVLDRLAEDAPEGGCGPDCGCLASAADPVVMCTLSDADRDTRGQDWRDLLATVTSREPIPGGLRLTWVADPSLAARVAKLAAEEQGCCAFFDFTLHLNPTALVLDVRAPAAAADLLTGLFGAQD